MKIVITGNMGYIGPVVVNHFRHVFPHATLVGYDSGFFAGCLLDHLEYPEKQLDEQVFGDVREISDDLFEGVNAVVHLAAISNDPMGHAFAEVTDKINHLCSYEVAVKAKDFGVKNFVFASSCSVYGAGGWNAKGENDSLLPLTSYARSKVAAEEALHSLAGDKFTVTCLRFATACGISPRLRLDLVLNDFVANALSTKKIEILSDGTPLRPLIDVKDMARAIEWASFRKAGSEDNFLIVNAGSNDGNYQVKDLAEAVRNELPETEIAVNPQAAQDKRSYKVDFSLFEKLAPNHQPQNKLQDSVSELISGMRDTGFCNPDFRNSSYVRLNALRQLQSKGKLNHELYWQ